ncbi:hypothetical protein Lfu02_39990 [Longispora fulva]|nr:hypothetical protein Lfu02_39990 [Longispora fulva]
MIANAGFSLPYTLEGHDPAAMRAMVVATVRWGWDRDIARRAGKPGESPGKAAGEGANLRFWFRPQPQRPSGSGSPG